MVVVVILGILAALVVPQVMSRPDQAKVTVARRRHQGHRCRAGHVQAGQLRLSEHPAGPRGAGEEARISNPQPKNWNKDGYLEEAAGRSVGQSLPVPGVPGTKGPFDLYSLGADGKEGGSDNDAEIGNWDN